MTALNMKSELLMESRLRAESRQPLQRRRIAKTASACAVLENGECDPDLNLAIQESLKLARENELKQQQANAALAISNYDEDEEKEPIATSPISKTDKACTKKQPESKTDQPQSVKDENPSSSNQIKGLLMLHLDLIQHQQELITSKDREIINLKDDKEALKCRLERMERRMAILKQKEDVLEASHHSQSVTSDSPAGLHLHCVDRSQKRKSSFESFGLNKKFANDTGRVSRTVNNATNRGKSSVRNEPSNQGLRISRRRAKSSEFVDNSETEENLRRQEFLQKRSKIQDEHSILRTEDLTPVLQYTPLFEDDDETIHERLRAGSEKQAEVEIPTWRFRTVPNCYTLEGTENLEDEVFLKRHQKPEYEEKRRKRWDLQRLREQRMYEHLKEKEKISDFVEPCRPKDNHTVSFYPSIEDITHIEVCERIPVSAFGCPIPCIKPSEFELPWEHQVKKSQHNERSTPKTNNRWNSRRR